MFYVLYIKMNWVFFFLSLKTNLSQHAWINTNIYPKNLALQEEEEDKERKLKCKSGPNVSEGKYEYLSLSFLFSNLTIW